MGDFVHRTTKQLLTSTSPSSLPEAEANYIEDPDLSAVAGEPSKYWTITGDVITLMSQAEQDAVDAALLTAQSDATADEIDAVETILRAFAEVVVDEINVLRAQHSLADRTLAQLKTAIRGKLSG